MRTLRREEFCDIEFTGLLRESAKKDYNIVKLALSRAEEAISQLGLEPLIRMADHVDIGQWSLSLTLSFQECVKPWLIPFLAESGHPWDEHGYWEVSNYQLWEEKDFLGYRRLLHNSHQETICHVLTLKREYLRGLRVNGRKRRPIDHIQVRIHQKSPGWHLGVLTLPDGCECRKELDAYVEDTVVSCRRPQ